MDDDDVPLTFQDRDAQRPERGKPRGSPGPRKETDNAAQRPEKGKPMGLPGPRDPDQDEMYSSGQQEGEDADTVVAQPSETNPAAYDDILTPQTYPQIRSVYSVYEFT